jgi:hypothetical protein
MKKARTRTTDEKQLPVVVERRKRELTDLQLLEGMRLDPQGMTLRAILEICDRFEEELKEFLHPDNPSEKRLEAATGIWGAQQLRIRFLQWNEAARRKTESGGA